MEDLKYTGEDPGWDKLELLDGPEAAEYEKGPEGRKRKLRREIDRLKKEKAELVGEL